VEVENRAQLNKQRRKTLGAANLMCTSNPDFRPIQAIETLRGYLLKLCDWGCALVAPPVATKTAASAAHTARSAGYQLYQPLNGKSPRGSLPFACPHIVMLHTLYSSSTDARTMWRDPSLLQPLVSAGYDAAAADVWSFGVTLWVCVCGSMPWSVAGPSSRRFRDFVRGTQPHVLGDEMLAPECRHWKGQQSAASSEPSANQSHWHWPSSFSPALVDLLSGCLKVRGSERLSMQAVMEHAWFRDPTWVPKGPDGSTPDAPRMSDPSHDQADEDGDCELIGSTSLVAELSRKEGGAAGAAAATGSHSAPAASMGCISRLQQARLLVGRPALEQSSLAQSPPGSAGRRASATVAKAAASVFDSAPLVDSRVQQCSSHSAEMSSPCARGSDGSSDFFSSSGSGSQTTSTQQRRNLDLKFTASAASETQEQGHLREKLAVTAALQPSRVRQARGTSMGGSGHAL